VSDTEDECIGEGFLLHQFEKSSRDKTNGRFGNNNLDWLVW
jgi:hypothetical protein